MKLPAAPINRQRLWRKDIKTEEKIMLTCHEMTEEEKYSICQWKYSGEYAIYDGMP